MEGIFLLLGSNRGDKRAKIEGGLKSIETRIGNINKRSGIYKTKAWGYKNQDSFLNLVIEITSVKSPKDILDEITEIEKSAGEKKRFKWGPRFLDIDILFYGDEIIEDANLIIPHPEIQNRNFTLKPLLEIAPELKHPILSLTITELYEVCKDRGSVKRLSH